MTINTKENIIIYSVIAIVIATLVSGFIILAPKIMNADAPQTKFIIQEVRNCTIGGYCDAMIVSGRIGIVIVVDTNDYRVGDTLMLTKK